MGLCKTAYPEIDVIDRAIHFSQIRLYGGIRVDVGKTTCRGKAVGLAGFVIARQSVVAPTLNVERSEIKSTRKAADAAD